MANLGGKRQISTRGTTSEFGSEQIRLWIRLCHGGAEKVRGRQLLRRSRRPIPGNAGGHRIGAAPFSLRWGWWWGAAARPGGKCGSCFVRLRCWGGVVARGAGCLIGFSADDVTYACSSVLSDAARPARRRVASGCRSRAEAASRCPASRSEGCKGREVVKGEVPQRCGRFAEVGACGPARFTCDVDFRSRQQEGRAEAGLAPG